MTIFERVERKETALTVGELASMVGQSPKTLYKSIKSGRLPAYRLGGSIRIDPHDAAEWLRKRRTK